jgi:hypothetical protein
MHYTRFLSCVSGLATSEMAVRMLAIIAAIHGKWKTNWRYTSLLLSCQINVSKIVDKNGSDMAVAEITAEPS